MAAQLFWLVVAGGYIVWCLVFSGIGLPLRETIQLLGRGEGAARSGARHVYRMLQCPYCTGFWTMVAAQAVLQFNVFGDRFAMLPDWAAYWAGVMLLVPALAALAGTVAFLIGHAVEQLPGAVQR